ncbi:MAG: 2-amino-4-hydroxy-6-hydroxymethyldihydropteridine diphosphokinase [Oleispira antarctica]|uniref:2-amino-4-hydroxy-6-hydroxymethyldihydropteridine pyrophosphokinase n=1 Tax=Oleispira antarctica RB-8 TaxID=698738 RepID=R4YPR6_OLEAN|nr:2-amino-4-hydroxy-6-hydroxymethyldihydropteridine diphosphokinase [Oleispira antarctica]MBQ0792619.1 2-amino-4-hydroxy-6-hydroxymethyldihydropteridine diphosphokinase [Oleispira antarctica]CCK76910.1 7, 8-dihydro-6-hydroxymethylpterin-pyrophosphokinase [Oleispira antarctica RB-8]|tara:strand:+ start:3794 stop:4192 length:399 start_codon:yes stop_codon:yes gene_type:complete
MMNYYLIGLGSNIQPERNITMARKEIAQHVDILNHSPVLINPPCGHTFQFTFHNQILLIHSLQTATDLKAVFEAIEVRLGREAKCPERRFKDRPIDIDILTQANTAKDALSTALKETYNQTIMQDWKIATAY